MRHFVLGIFFVVILFIVILSLPSRPVYGEGTYTGIGTGDGIDGSNDAINFSQGRVWTIDQYGKYIWLTQTRGPTNHWAWSNDLGANWSQSTEGYTALTRGSVAYDSINDVLHVIWAATDTNDGIIYRRYSITRDGSNNITSIQRMDSGTVNLQLDTSASRAVEQPVALWVNDGSTDGSLVAIWMKQGTSMTEVRGSMRKLSMTADDGTAGNWQAIDNSSDTFSTDPPAVAADKIYGITTSQRVAASATVRGGTGSRKDDLYVFVAQTDTGTILAYRAIWSSANNDWRGGIQSPVTVGTMNSSSGYTLKEQLITKPVLDSANDRLYVGWARWKDVSAGDTVSIAYLNSTDTASSTYDVYSANGTHSYAPTIDIAFDQTLGSLYASYIESTTNGDNGSINYKTFDGTSLSSATRFYTTPGGTAGANGSADIPILYENRTSNDRLLFAFRINGALPPTGVDPHTINWGYITLATPTPTPTPTPTVASSASSSSSSSSSSTSSSTSTPICTQETPASSPDLFATTVNRDQVIVYFAPAAGQVDSYYISYSTKNDALEHGASFAQGYSSGVLSYSVNSLNLNTTYYFKVRAGNGCQPGKWSKIIAVKTGGKSAITRSVAPQSLDTKACIYSVKKGDSLWKISQEKLGSGQLYTTILEQNKVKYPKIDSILAIGSKLSINCPS